jgi:CubicO group peptidase (beta-lactamase class C family)
MHAAGWPDLPDLMNRCLVPGLSIAVEADGEPLWAAGYGTIAAGSSTPVGPRTAFQACSISKHVAAFGAVRLVGQGVLALDEDVNRYLTSWRLPTDGWVVTVRQVLAHTAGLSYNWFRGRGAGEPVPTLLDVLDGRPPADTPPVRPSLLPGSRFRYSGSHYAVLQQLMVDVTGEGFEELMRALVFQPLAMADSSYDQSLPYRRPDLVASGHHNDGVPVRGGWRTIVEQAGAGLWTTPSDLVRLEREIVRAAEGRSALLSAELAGEMLTPQVPGGYGLGTAVDGTRFGHDGGNIGYCCFSYAWTGSGAAVAMMSTVEDAMEVKLAVLAVAEQRYRRPPAQAIDDVAGRYLLREGYPVDISRVDGRLTFAVAGQPDVALEPLPGGRYRVPGLDCDLAFRGDGDSGVVMDLREGAAVTTCRRTVSG